MIKPKPAAGRYERKYLVPTHCAEYLETLIKLHPKFFSEIHQTRIINNIYFDDQRLTNYFENLNGVGYRLKHRLRWYSPDYIFLNTSQNFSLKGLSSPHFEIKKRTGDIISKYLYRSSSVYDEISSILPESIKLLFREVENSFTNNFSYEAKKSQQLALRKIKQYQPVIVNSYTRKYFLSANHKVRLTIDSDIRFHEIFNKRINWKHYFQLPATILEIKADREYDQEMADTAKFFPLPLTKSSKYVLGTMSCLPDIESPLYKIPVQPRLVKQAFT